MILKKAAPLFLLIFCSTLMFGQDREPLTAIFGKISQADVDFKTYEDNPETAAVVLFESSKNTYEVINNSVRLVKNVHRKIKVLDASRFDGASVSIPYYHNSSSSEKVLNIEAMTHNGMARVSVNPDDIYTVDNTENWSDKRFTFPTIKNGSILEYRYRLESPYFFNFGNWEFQNKYPTLYSEIRGDIPANYVYARSLTGSRPLDVKITELKKNCLEINGFEASADCDSFIYGMYNVPAYKEEPFMLATDNYISKLSFEFQQSTDFNGYTDVYSKTWKDVDQEFKHEKDVGKQLRAISFFKDKLPPEILAIQDSFEKAKQIYSFIQNHYTWNGEYRIFSDVRVKDAYKEKTGNLAEINISLINMLKAAGFDVHLALGSLRQHGLISDLYPTLTDFNYIVGHITINDKVFLLDATRPEIPFGTLPFEMLNGRVRVMDFDKGSYWHNIIPTKRNVDYYNIDLTLTDDAEFTGKMQEIHSGYRAIAYRRAIEEHKIEKLHGATSNIDFDLEDTKYESKNEDIDKPVKINHTLISEATEASDIIYFYPLSFDFERLDNPFKDSSRLYPVDLGYTRSSTYAMNIQVPEGYTIVALPVSKIYKLLDNAGSCTFSYKLKGPEIECLVRYNLDRYRFTAEQYANLRDFFQGIEDEHKNAVIKIKKV